MAEPARDSSRIVWSYFIVGAVVSAATWLLAPALHDRREPWDSPIYLYRGGLLSAGLLIGFIRPRPFGRGLPSAWAGAWLGQIPFVVFSVFRSLGLWATAFGALFFVGGVFIGNMFRLSWRRAGTP